MTEILFTLFSFVVMISAIVIIHEFGHYIAARAFGLIGTHFSLGFGPKIAAWTDRRGTEWRLAPFLLGGYVSFPGQDKKIPLEPGQKTLNALPRWQRAIVVGAGPGINLLLAVLLFSAIAAFWGYPVGRPILQSVTSGSPADKAGLAAGDRIVTFDGRRILTSNDLTQNIMLQPGGAIAVTYERGGQTEFTTVHLGQKTYRDPDGNPAKIGFMGVKVPSVFKKASNPVEAISQGVSDGAFMTWAQFETLHQIIQGRRSVTEMSGPVRIAKMSAHTMLLGLMPFLYLMAMISIAVGVMNLMPIPGLDGGHLATYAVESVLRRDLPEKAADRLVKIGLCIVGCLGVFAITMDIMSLR